MIDEKKLIEDIWKLSRSHITEWETGGILALIEKQPKIGWIPCEERLPDNAGMYLATYVYENAKIVEIMFFDGKKYYYPDDMLGISQKIVEVIAWQPLPQPFKKEGAENECN